MPVYAECYFRIGLHPFYVYVQAELLFPPTTTFGNGVPAALKEGCIILVNASKWAAMEWNAYQNSCHFWSLYEEGVLNVRSAIAGSREPRICKHRRRGSRRMHKIITHITNARFPSRSTQPANLPTPCSSKFDPG